MGIVRDQLAEFIGQRLLDVTEHDPEEYRQTREAYALLMFENGGMVKITLTDSGNGEISIEELDYGDDGA